MTSSSITGYTLAVRADAGPCSLSLLIAPDTDFDSSFRAWDIDAFEFITVNGWLFSFEVQS